MVDLRAVAVRLAGSTHTSLNQSAKTTVTSGKLGPFFSHRFGFLMENKR